MRKYIKVFISVLVLVAVAISLFISGVKAMNTSSIENQIIKAQQRLEKAENALLSKDTELFLIYRHTPYSELGGKIETKLREKYSKEYWEYIEARAILDDLRHIQFLMLINGVPKESK